MVTEETQLIKTSLFINAFWLPLIIDEDSRDQSSCKTSVHSSAAVSTPHAGTTNHYTHESSSSALTPHILRTLLLPSSTYIHNVMEDPDVICSHRPLGSQANAASGYPRYPMRYKQGLPNRTLGSTTTDSQGFEVNRTRISKWKGSPNPDIKNIKVMT